MQELGDTIEPIKWNPIPRVLSEIILDPADVQRRIEPFLSFKREANQHNIILLCFCNHYYYFFFFKASRDIIIPHGPCGLLTPYFTTVLLYSKP